MKTVLTKILPLLLPLVIYALWLYQARRKATAAGGPMPGVRDAPWTWLAAVGLVSMIAGLLALGWISGEEPGGVYIPTHLEDGVVVPGRFER